MGRVNTEQLGWTVPAAEFERFEEAVAENAASAGRAASELERAWFEFAETDELEEYADEALALAGHPRDAARKNKNPLRVSSSADVETRTCWLRVHPDVKAAMKAYADKHDEPPHVVLRAVMTWYVDGTREQRVRRKLARAMPSLRQFASEATDGERGESMGVTERRTVEIAKRLGPVFNEAELHDAIAEQGLDSAPSVEKYTGKVADYKGVRRWEYDDEKADMFFPPEKYREKQTSEIINALDGDALADEGPTDAEGDPTGFTKQAFANAAGTTGVEISDANRETVNDYRERVLARLDYAWSDPHHAFVPAATARAAPNQSEAETDAESDASGDTDAESETTTETDDVAESERVSDPAADAEAEAAALMNATPARARTDGGRDVTVVADVGRATLPPGADEATHDEGS